MPFPALTEITIQFSHVAYPLEEEFSKRGTGISHYQTWSPEDSRARMPGADVLVISGFWDNALLDVADRLKYIQSIGAGFDQFPLDELRERGIRLASAQGTNKNGVSEHAMALILGLSRKIHDARDNQRKHFWRQMISDIPMREDELAGKTMGIIGMGQIGSRVAKLAKAFDMRVIATKRDINNYEGPADEVLPPDQVDRLFRESDWLVLNCPLTPETRGIVDARALEMMKPSAFLINVARGACVDEEALIEALRTGAIAGAGLDHFYDDPLPPESPIWDLDNAIITPHTGGETQLYEANLLDIMMGNLERLARGETELHNEIV
ncbi:MAG: D-2-hydroxyacid dehydrogenase [Chloroflexi bacterium]|nr:D-2-hydroxyacid dehydrogenase [Chloroflexota bacterium]